ncbi:rhodanese-like domain-containing protein [Halobacteriales archaeon QS_5_70_15]|nr:MAG: rhodanese-like domain-containing protein [Halobacteriales archaeon QS_5_70_15]
MDDEISTAELRDLLESGSVRVVDIRSPEAFARGHIPGSENLPFAELTGRIEEFTDDDRVVTVCPHGKASVQAARLIGSYEGFEGEVASLAPGIEGWAEECDLEADDGPEAGTARGAEAEGGPEAPF